MSQWEKLPDFEVTRTVYKGEPRIIKGGWILADEGIIVAIPELKWWQFIRRIRRWWYARGGQEERN